MISILALIVACAGTALAAGYLITSPSQIRPGTIVGSNIHRGTVTAANLAPSAIKRLRPTLTVVRTVGKIPASTGMASVKATCPRGQQATGGGFGNDGPTVVESRPEPRSGTPRGWLVTAFNTSLPPADQPQSVYVVCAR